MVRSYAYRTALIALLPVIAILLYIEGQRYDPALIRFEETQPAGSSISQLLPERIEAFNRLGSVRFYTKDNLYEYVNGHAEYFISAGFVSLAVGEYSALNTADTAPEFIIDVYDMGKGIQAFGVISDESRGSLSDIAGMTGFRAPAGISFINGQYYVKLSSFSDTVPLDTLAARISAFIGATSDPFPEFSRLPDIGTVTATRFVKEAYRGLDFLDNVMEREYVINGNTVQVFIVTREMGDINAITESFIKYFKHSGIDFSRRDRADRTIYRVRDPYEGDWTMIVSRDMLVGVFGASDRDVVDSFLKALEK